MPTHYVEDYDGKKNADAVEREQIPLPPEGFDDTKPFAQAKVVEEDPRSRPAKKTSTAKTKG